MRGILRIERVAETPTRVTVRLSGGLTADRLSEIEGSLREAESHGQSVTLDLSGVDRVDRKAVSLLVAATGRGCHLLHCPAYVANWCRAEERRRARSRQRKRRLTLVAICLALFAAAARGETLTLSLKEAVERALSDGTASRIASEHIDQAADDRASGAFGPPAAGRPPGLRLEPVPEPPGVRVDASRGFRPWCRPSASSTARPRSRSRSWTSRPTSATRPRGRAWP